MNGSILAEQSFQIADQISSLESYAASSQEVIAASHRLQGRFFGSRGYRAVQLIARSGFSTKPIGELAQVFWPGMFKRIEVSSTETGVPFLTTSEMMLARATPTRYISKALTPYLSSLQVTAGTILV